MPLGERLPLRGRTLRHLLLENCLWLQAMTDCRSDRMTQPAAPIQQTTITHDSARRSHSTNNYHP